MKRLLISALIFLCAVSLLSAQYKKKMVDIPREKLADNAFPLVSIHDVQYQPPDSLHFCDSVVSKSGPASSTAAWFAQTSPYYKGHHGNVIDTIEIVGQIIVPPKIVTFTGYGAYNFTLRDTAASATGAWMSVFVRTASDADTLALFNSEILTYFPGDIIRLRGYADEFPPSNFVSYTEFVPVADGFVVDLTRSPMTKCVEYIDTRPVPAPDVVTAGEFMKGVYTSSGNNIQFSTGEQWEDCYVQLTNLTVTEKVNATNGTVGLVDQYYNEISTMDGSKWFTLRSGTATTSPTIPYRDPSSTYTMPVIGQVIDTIRGYIATNSGSDAPRGYRIYPVFPGDIVLGNVLLLPSISTHRRNPIALKSTDSAVVTVKAYQQTNGANVKSVTLRYSLNNGKWNQVLMTGPNPADSTWQGIIPPQPANTFVKYFCAVTDSINRSVTYASAAGGSVWQDTSQGFFFYTVLDRPLTISDIQYSPFPTGLTGLLGDTATVDGVVTADTGSININSSGALPLYIQNGNAPWSGIWIAAATGDTMLYKIHNGDSVRVTGVVQEYAVGLAGQLGRVTRLGNTSVDFNFSSGHTLPAPVLLKTGAFNVGNGDPGAEPYEDMAVRFNNVSVADTAPTYSDATEYTVIDSLGGPIIVRCADGKNKYSVVPGDTLYERTILRKGDKFSYIQGIIYFSYNQYKLIPRGNDDFGKYTSILTGISQQGSVPLKFGLKQNYPNPFNPSTKIEFDIPVGGLISLKVYNILGQEIASLANGYHSAGHYIMQFDASRFSSGLYIYRLKSASGTVAKKMLLIK